MKSQLFQGVGWARSADGRKGFRERREFALEEQHGAFVSVKLRWRVEGRRLEAGKRRKPAVLDRMSFAVPSPVQVLAVALPGEETVLFSSWEGIRLVSIDEG